MVAGPKVENCSNRVKTRNKGIQALANVSRQTQPTRTVGRKEKKPTNPLSQGKTVNYPALNSGACKAKAEQAWLTRLSASLSALR